MKRYIRASADDELILTNDRAMGDAYLVFADDDKFIVLCDGGLMQIYRTLRNLGMTVHEAKHISNMQADSYQQRGDYDTYRIGE